MSATTIIFLVGAAMLLLAVGGFNSIGTLIDIVTGRLFLVLAGLLAAALASGYAQSFFSATREKLRGVDISAPVTAVFGSSTRTVPCTEHEGPFRDAVRGQQMRCHRTLQPGESQVVQLFGGNWGLHPSDSPVSVTLWKSGRPVYGPGPYLGDRLPVADRVEVRAHGPADIIVSMMKTR